MQPKSTKWHILYDQFSELHSEYLNLQVKLGDKDLHPLQRVVMQIRSHELAEKTAVAWERIVDVEPWRRKINEGKWS